MEMDKDIIKFTVNEAQEGQRIDSVLSLLMEDCSRSFVQRLIEEGCVSVGAEAPAAVKKKNERLKSGQQINIVMPEIKSIEALPEEMPLDIIYEDEDLIIINKPKGLVVHPGAGNESGTLVNGLLHHCGQLSLINGVQRPGIVHRIDKDTSGLLVCAKSDLAHRELSKQLELHSMTRRYIGICFFGFNQDEGTINAPIARDPRNRLRMAVVPGGRASVTHYTVLERYKGFTLFEARLETGRTHQIRVHMASRNRALLGDRVYGSQKQPFGLSSQLLHARLLGFKHPRSGEYIEFSAEAPEEFKRVIEKLRRL